MKLLFSLLLLTITFSYENEAIAAAPNLLLIDSSFAPQKIEKFDLGKTPCLVISESAELAEDKGDCYGVEEWQEAQAYDASLLKGMMNTLAGIDGVDNNKWKEFNATKAEEAKKIRNNYILSVHGSRASYIAYHYSEKKAEILPLRVLSANIGSVKQKQSVALKPDKNLKNYSLDCQLVNWPKKEVSLFHSGKKLQAYQNKISEILSSNPSIKVISISLGYKKSWIQEDNAKCDSAAVNKEYQVLVDSWSNLLLKFNDRLFVVAAGNENMSFDEAAAKEDDLWATLIDKENLILVGSLKKNGEKFPSSNYGKKVLMVKGEDIEALSPLPTQPEGHKTTVRGTSFSAPIISGLAVKILDKLPLVSMKELRTGLSKVALEIK